jgi:predicted nucleic acid-binding protein
MTGKYFADTNVLVYAFDSGESAKMAVAQELLDRFGGAGELIVSTQVLREFFVAVTRKLKPAVPLGTAYEAVENFACYPTVGIGLDLILAAIRR